MKQYVSVHFDESDEVRKEVLNYHLCINEVESIEDQGQRVVAYFIKEKWLEVKDRFNDYTFTFQEVENQNWNLIWEASFEPVEIDNFCFVRAPFHPKNSDSSVIDIILEPKMAFGTAHHETTYMMIAEMKNLKFNDKKVFDYGCGTAILSILAEKLGAGDIYAIDIEENAVENAIYNAEINGCKHITCEQKTLSEIESEAYDIILANINRRVLLESASRLVEFLNPAGDLLLSGILKADEQLILERYKKEGFHHIKTRSKGEWLCMHFKHPNS